MYKKRNQLLGVLVCLLDCVMAVCAFLLAGAFRYGSLAAFFYTIDVREGAAVVMVLTVVFSFGLGDFGGMIRRGFLRTLYKVVQANLCVFAGITIYSFSTRNAMELSRLTLIYFALLSIVLQYVTHLASQWCQGKGFLRSAAAAPHLLIFVEEAEAAQAVARARRASNWHIVLAGIVLTDRDATGERIGDAPVVASLDTYLEYATGHVVDEVLILPGALTEEQARLREIIVQLETMGIVVNLHIQAVDTGLNDIKRVYRFGSYDVIGFSTRLFDVRLLLLKRLMDILGGLVGVLLTGLAALVVAPLIAFGSPGPVFFAQQRVGRNGRIFRMYKFRSMYRDAEQRKAALMDQNEVSGPFFKVRADPRVTPIGRFLRRASIDEMPQFLNVLKGDMSLVGVRPPTVQEYAQYNARQKRRLSFRPGLTGLWQVSGRSDIADFDEVVKLDLEYIDSWSIALDSKILLKTVKAVLERKGAA